ncbi:hypothetical protein GBF38_017396, partial [Nibea albiflora]
MTFDLFQVDAGSALRLVFTDRLSDSRMRTFQSSGGNLSACIAEDVVKNIRPCGSVATLRRAAPRSTVFLLCNHQFESPSCYC